MKPEGVAGGGGRDEGGRVVEVKKACEWPCEWPRPRKEHEIIVLSLCFQNDPHHENLPASPTNPLHLRLNPPPLYAMSGRPVSEGSSALCVAARTDK